MTRADPLAALADIELPAPPDWRPMIVLTAAVLLLILAGALIIHRRRRRQRNALISPLTRSPVTGERDGTLREALARLDRLQREWSSGAVDARAAAYRLGALLRIGLGMPQLHPASPPSNPDAREWRETLTLLQGLRYAPRPSHALTHETFERARRWLQHSASREERHV